MDSALKTSIRKKLGDLLIEAGIVKPEQLPKGLGFAQKATEADLAAIAEVRSLVLEQGLDVPTALRALSLTKHRHCTVDVALSQIGWRPRKIMERIPSVSPFSSAELDAIGRKGAPVQSTPPAQPDPPSHTASPPKPAFSKEELDAIGVKAPDKNGNGIHKEQFDAVALNQQTPSADVPAYTKEELDAIGAKSGAQSTGNFSLGTAGGAMLSPPPLPVPGKPVAETAEAIAAKIAEADRLAAAGEFAKSEAWLLKAVHAMESNPDSSVRDIADVLFKLGKAAFQQNAFPRAETYYTRALKIRELNCGQDSIEVVECLDALAELFDVQSQCLDAEQYYLSSLGIKERIFAPGSSELTAALKKLVAVSKRAGPRPEEKLSGQLLTEAGLLDAFTLEKGLLHAQQQGLPIGRALVSLQYLNEDDLKSVLQAQLLLKEGVLPGFLAVRALRLASQQGLPFVQALTEIGLEPSDPQAAAAFALLEVAEQLLQAERDLSPEHPEIASLCLKFGDLHLEHRRFREAHALFKRAVAIAEKDPQDRDRYIETHLRLANLHYSTGEYAHAEVLYSKLMEVFEQDASYSDPLCITVMESLATVKYMNSQFEEAGRLYDLSIGAKQKLLGPRHPGLANSLQGRANCYYMLKQYDDAEDLYKFTMAVIENVYGANCEQVASPASVLADLYYVQGLFARAQTEYLHCLDALSNAANPDIDLFCTTLVKLAHCCTEQNDFAKADAYYRHLEKTRRSCGTHMQPDMCDILERHAEVLDRMSRRDESAVIRQKAQAIRGAQR